MFPRSPEQALVSIDGKMLLQGRRSQLCSTFLVLQGPTLASTVNLDQSAGKALHCR